MSVLASSDRGYFVSHEDFLLNTYEVIDLRPAEAMFDLRSPFLKEAQARQAAARMLDPDGHPPRRKRSRKDKSVSESTLKEKMSEVNLVQESLKSVLEIAKANGYLGHCQTSEDIAANNFSSREFSDFVFQKSNITGEKSWFSGGNSSDLPVVQNIQGQNFVFPAKSCFFCGDLFNMGKFLAGELFDLVIIDPPWWNKYIRRRKSADQTSSYSMMYNKDLAQIAVSDHLASGALVAVWCTNSPSNIEQLKQEVFSAWQLEFVATWFWAKVTNSGETICEFSIPPGKQPYERILLGRKIGRDRILQNPENNKVIVSVPSAIHSHKPPLTELLAKFLPESPKTLELFARSLLPNTTSCGLQVLKLQHEVLFSTTNKVFAHNFLLFSTSTQRYERKGKRIQKDWPDLGEKFAQ